MTPSESATEGATQRLHPLSLLFSLGSAARRLLLPGLVLFFASRGSNYEFWLMLIFFPAAGTALVKYLSFRYRLGEEEMVIRQGIVTRNERHIPYARIQNINLVQNPLHRWLGVAEVQLETASGDKPEAVIRVLSLASVEQLRAHVFRGREPGVVPGVEGADASPSLPPSRTLLSLSPRDLVLFGLISNRGMAVVAAAMGLVWQLDLFDDWNWEQLPAQLESSAGWLPASLTSPGPVLGAALGLSALFVALLLLRVLSVIWAQIKFHGFTLKRREDDLRAAYGLFTRITATIPRGRIQLLSARTTPLHRWCRRAALQAETAGGSGGAEQGGPNRLWLAPLLPVERLAAMVGQVLPDVDLEQVSWQRLPARAEARVRNRALVVLLLITAAAVGASRAWWGLLLLVPGLPWIAFNAHMVLRHTAWAITPSAVLYRSGWWVRRLSVVRFAKVQTVSLGESPFDRRHGMATLAVDTAGAGKVGHRVAIQFLPLQTARELLARLSDEAGRRSFQW